MSTTRCPACAAENDEAARFCGTCGAPVHGAASATASPSTRTAPTDSLALVAVALALSSFAGVGTLGAIVLGHRAKRRIDASGGAVGGRRLALAALAVAYATLACALVVAVTLAVRR
jgi:hypothetical protein